MQASPDYLTDKQRINELRSEIDQTHQVMVVKARGMLAEDYDKMIEIRAVLSGIYDDAILQPAEVSI